MRIQALLALAISACLVLPACHRPHGAMIPWSGGSHTYWSTETQPKTVRLVDLRTDEVLFNIDIPPGKQLVIDFLSGEGDDPVYTPDLMRYEVMDLGNEFGKLRSAMSIPAAPSRRLEMSIRQGPEYVTAAPDRVLRTDELGDRPDWWTPRGGQLPNDPEGLANYDN